MELKTLKDIKHLKVIIEEYIKDEKIVKHELFISTIILKQEAIKWIKNCKPAKIEKTHFLTSCTPESRCIRCYWIKHFFGITEKDLK